MNRLMFVTSLTMILLCQATQAEETEGAKQLAQAIERNARVITLFNPKGEALRTVGRRSICGDPVFSPDGKHIAIVRTDLERDTADLWVVDLKTSIETRITNNTQQDSIRTPIWS